MFICFGRFYCYNYFCPYIYWDNFSVDREFFPANSVSCFSAIKLQHDVDLVIEPVDVASHSNSKLFI